jgi:hypothetical protein
VCIKAATLEEDASDWFSSLDDNKYATINDLIEGFTERWGDKKEHRHLLAALHSIKKNENETWRSSIRNLMSWSQVFTLIISLQLLQFSFTILRHSMGK